MILAKIETNSLVEKRPFWVRMYNPETNEEFVYDIKCDNFDQGTYEYLIDQGWTDDCLFNGMWTGEQFRDHWRDKIRLDRIVGWDGRFNAEAFNKLGIKVYGVSLLDLFLFKFPERKGRFSLRAISKDLNLTGSDWENLIEIYKMVRE